MNARPHPLRWSRRSQDPLLVRDGATVTMLCAGLTVHQIGADGELDIVRMYDVDVGRKIASWSGVVALAQPTRKYAPTWSSPGLLHLKREISGH